MKSHVRTNTGKMTARLTVCAAMAAMSTVLSFIKFAELPYGGSVTLFSFVPVLFAGYAYGWRWGIGTGIVYGIMQTVFGISGAVAGAGFKWWQVMLCALLDYIAAGAMLGTAGMFRKAVKKPRLSFALGTATACLLKLASHFLSGYILFSGWAEWYFSEGAGTAFGEKILGTFAGNGLSAVYSLMYNASFMVPELIISVIMAVIIISVKPICKVCEIE